MYNYYSAGAYQYREGIRNDYYVIDKVITALGFSGVENTDWTNIFSTN